MKKTGIDISKWQNSIDFAKVKADGIEFAILRSSYRNTTDPRFFEYVKGCKENGIPILGIYHFIYALNEAQALEEAKFCVKQAQAAGLSKDTVIFTDFEYDTVNNAKKRNVTLTKADCIKFTTIFCEYVESQGYKAGIYTNIDFYKNWYEPSLFKKYIFWLADYNGEANYDCDIRQYTSSGSVNGIEGKVDMNSMECADVEKDDEPAVEEPAKEIKDNNTIADEVIKGLWGNGDERKQKLEAAGYNASEIQEIVNKKVKAEEVKEVIAIKKASDFDERMAGTYKSTANLYMRNGAGKKYEAMCVIPKGGKAVCYGFYSMDGGIEWPYVEAVVEGVKYTGFCCGSYLKK